MFVKMNRKSFLLIVVLLIYSLLADSCGPNQTSTRNIRQDNSRAGTRTAETRHNPEIPDKVYEVYNYIKEHHQAPEGIVGGRRFGNFEKKLPLTDDHGRRISYQEWDVNPHLQHKNRGTERIITGSDGRAYYTNNHYQSFTEIN